MNPLPTPSLRRAPLLRRLVLTLLWAALVAGCSQPPEPTINLYRAIQLGDLDQIKRHIYWGTDINVPDPSGSHPLHVAAAQGEVVIAETLVDHGADLEARDGAGRTALYLALRDGKTQVAQLLIRRGARHDASALLFDLVREGVTDRDSLRYIKQLGADVNALDAAGEAPLHIAAASGNVLLCKRLIALGSDINLRSAAGRTPLEIAAERGNPYVVELLRSYGAKAAE